jgi:hypothetical protein
MDMKPRTYIPPDELIKNRYEAVIKGWMNSADIRKCVPCGASKACQIRRTIEANVKMEGFENIMGGILTPRFLDYMHLSESKIKKDYENLMKGETKK